MSRPGAGDAAGNCRAAAAAAAGRATGGLDAPRPLTCSSACLAMQMRALFRRRCRFSVQALVDGARCSYYYSGSRGSFVCSLRCSRSTQSVRSVATRCFVRSGNARVSQPAAVITHTQHHTQLLFRRSPSTTLAAGGSVRSRTFGNKRSGAQQQHAAATCRAA